MKRFAIILVLAICGLSNSNEVRETPPPCSTQTEVFNRGIALCLYQTGSFVLDFSYMVDPVTNCCKGEIEVTDTDNVTKVWKWEETDCCITCDIPM